MQEHPVPQNITSYEFHLVGNMTLKQFFELAGGGVLGFLTYSSNLPIIFKYPLAFLFVILGIAMAFIPLEERPLDQWFLAFIRAIYNPTKFHWKKSMKIPDFFTIAQKRTQSAPTQAPVSAQEKSSRVQAYLDSIAKPAEQDAFDAQMRQRITELNQLYAQTPAAGHIESTAQADILHKPDLSVRVRSLHFPNFSPISGSITVSEVIATHRENNIALPTAVPSQNVITDVQLPDQGGGPIAVSYPAAQEADTANTKVNQQYHVAQVDVQSQEHATTSAQTNANLPFPKTPTTPNVIVGMILDAQGRIIENAIVDIHTKDGFPVRALRSNRLGQFFSSSPLKSGEYEVSVEKAGFQFDVLSLPITNSIVAPLDIRAKE